MINNIALNKLMSQNIYILYNDDTKEIAEKIDARVISNELFESVDMTLNEDILKRMATNCLVEYFYVITTISDILFPAFDFSFKPPYWDSQYTHIWDNDPTIKLFSKKEVLKNPSAFTDECLQNGKMKLKNIDKKIYEYPVFDIIFLSYDEFNAEQSFDKLKLRFPRSKRIHGIKGIREAHKAAAELAETEMFYVVDADAEVVPTFDFSYHPTAYDDKSVHIWYSKNPVNGLEYGYGGIKLFPKSAILSYNGLPIDFTTSVSKHVKVIPEIANITHFDTDPFSTWRSAFRECVKLSTGFIDGQIPEETAERLKVWCNVGNGEFGNFSIAGAKKGVRFGKAYINQPESLRLINDFGWLEKKFNS